MSKKGTTTTIYSLKDLVDQVAGPKPAKRVAYDWSQVGGSTFKKPQDESGQGIYS